MSLLMFRSMVAKGARMCLVVVALVVLYLLCVVVHPAMVYPNLPLDTLEAIAWGKQWQWGYTKWPYVSGWVSALAAGISHPNGWALYTLSAVCVLVAFRYAYLYVRDRLGSALATDACLLSAMLYVFYITTLEFNVNVLLLPLYSAFLYHYLKAIETQSCSQWFIVGVCAGLGVMTKYTMLLYVFPACLMLLFSAQGRCSWRHPGVYMAMLLSMLICMPNLCWLYHHGWVSLNYATHRSGHANIGKYPFLAHRGYLVYLFNPLKLLSAFFITIVPSLLVFCWRSGVQWVWSPMADRQDHWHRVVPLAPILLMMLLAACGCNVHAAYLLPLFVWVGPSLILCFESKPLQGKRWAICLAVCMVCYSGGFAMVNYLKVSHRQHKITRSYFVGNEMGYAAESFWKQHSDGRPLKYVVGDDMWWVANVGFYAPSYPQSLFEKMALQREHASMLHAGVLVVLHPGATLKPWQESLAPLHFRARQSVVLARGSHRWLVDFAIFLP